MDNPYKPAINAKKIYMTDKKLDKTVSIITGAGGGLGRAMALKFSDEGSSVVVADVSDSLGKETAGAIEKNGGRSIFVHTDVSSESDVKNLVDRTMSAFGKIDILVNNAGIEPPNSLSAELSADQYDRVMNINLKGAWLLSKYVIPNMARQKSGSIINIASVAGILPLANAMPYSVSKAGIIMLTKSIALEYGKLGIRCNSISPGWVETSIIDRSAKNMGISPEDFKKYFEQKITLGRFANPEEIANVALFLASRDSSYVLGHNFVVDGGLTID